MHSLLNRRCGKGRGGNAFRLRWLIRLGGRGYNGGPFVCRIHDDKVDY